MLLVGKKTEDASVDGVLSIETGDKMTIKCTIPPGEEIGEGFVQLHCTVTGNTSVEVFNILPLNPQFDLETYNDAVNMMNTETHRGLFFD